MSTTLARRDIASVKCTAGRGMFPHEVGVLIKGQDRWYESMIDSELVQLDERLDAEGTETSGRIPVVIVDVDDARRAALIELPRQVVMGGRRIWVPMSEIEPAV